METGHTELCPLPTGEAIEKIGPEWPVGGVNTHAISPLLDLQGWV